MGGEAGSSTWSPKAVRSLRNWLNECIESHHDCKNIFKSTLPKRFIDVNPYDTDIEAPVTVDDINSLSIDAMPHVKLRLTAGLPDDTEYLTLSHCWGKSIPIKLQNDLLPIFEDMIPVTDLLKAEAKVFREAICVTRCLGYRYLWIDALCINQDDDGEKAAEISRMDEIFSGAAANLSATAASSGAEGMFFAREHNLYELLPCAWEKPTRNQERQDYFVAHMDREDPNREPANKRAWIYQERILAPRVIHFCKNQIYRECAQESLDELHDCIPWIIPPKYNPQAYVKRHGQDVSGDKDRKEHWYDQFDTLMVLYSDSILTFPQDRLPSFAGIAKAISVHSGLAQDQYLAGIWKGDLPRALLWYAWYRGSRNGGRRWDPEHVGYISPSWSWAGCEAPQIRVRVDPGRPFEGLAEVTRVWTVPAILDGSPFGALSDGGMTLKGMLVEIHRKRIGEGFLILIHDGDAQFKDALYFEPSWPPTARECGKRPEGHFKEIEIYWDRGEKQFERDCFPPWQVDASLDSGFWDEVDPEVLYLLPVGQCPSMGEAKETHLMGLVLERDDTTGRFKRVGNFSTYTEDPKGVNDEVRLRLLKSRKLEVTII